MTQFNPHAQYLRTAVETATPTRLVVMLYDGAIRFLSQAMTAMQARNVEDQSRFIGRAQDIIAHLHAHLDYEAGGAVARQLATVYAPMFDMLTYANIQDDPERVEKVLTALRELREAWVEVDRLCQAGKAVARDLRPPAGTDGRIDRTGRIKPMSLSSRSAERAKYGYLLQLAREQIQALESDDLFAFDRILAAKRTLIESLTDGRTLVAADPVLQKQVTLIQEIDATAQRLLYRKVGKIMREMAELQQFKKARRAYALRPGPNRLPAGRAQVSGPPLVGPVPFAGLSPPGRGFSLCRRAACRNPRPPGRTASPC